MSEFGGLFKLASTVIYHALYPITQYLYFMVMIKRLYFAKTKEDGVFQSPNPQSSHYI